MKKKIIKREHNIIKFTDSMRKVIDMILSECEQNDWYGEVYFAWLTKILAGTLLECEKRRKNIRN